MPETETEAAEVTQTDVTLEESTLDESAANITAAAADEASVKMDASIEQPPAEVKNIKLLKPAKKEENEAETLPAVNSEAGGNVISRSGRKIKVKRYMDEEEEAANIKESPPAKKRVPAEGKLCK